MASDIHHEEDRILDAPDHVLHPDQPLHLAHDACVICLDHISERAIALPCKHENFDFLCLRSWLQRQKVCPLCKSAVKSIGYDLDALTGHKIFDLRPSQPDRLSRRTSVHQTNDFARRQRQTRRISRNTGEATASATTKALDRRKSIYVKKMFSCYIGTSRISRYKDLTPSVFARDSILQSRARRWIRRELQVFDFLNTNSPRGDPADRRASNAEFLLEYIVAILKQIEIKGSGGQAEELLKDFLGRETTRIFLHELEAWLRSPFERLGDWDRAVQYDNDAIHTLNYAGTAEQLPEE